MPPTKKNGIEGYNLDQRAAEETYERLKEINWRLMYAEETYEGLSFDELTGLITSELETMYPYVNNHVFYRGCGIYPTINDNNEIVGSEWQEIRAASGIHDGFQLVVYEGDEDVNYQAMHRIRLDSLDEAIGTTERNQRGRYFFLDPKSASIIPTDDLDNVFPNGRSKSEDPKILLNNFDLYSLRIQKLITSKAFRTRTPEVRNRQLEEAISVAEVESGLRGREIALQADYGFAPIIDSETLQLAPVDLRGMIVSGVCMAFGSMQTFKTIQERVRTDLERINGCSGLCMVIDPDELTRPHALDSSDQVIYVPSFQIGHLETL